MSVQWNDLFAALGIVLVIEGILPLLNPAAAQRVFAQLAKLGSRELRLAACVSVAAGIVLLYIARS